MWWVFNLEIGRRVENEPLNPNPSDAAAGLLRCGVNPEG